MISCPNCEQSRISRRQLILQELTVPGVRAICGSCGSHVGIKQDGLIVSFWIEIVFFAMILASAIYLTIWLGVFLFVLWSLVRMVLKSNGKLEKYE